MSQGLNDQDFLFGYLGDYLDGTLAGQDATRLESMIASGTHKDVSERFQIVRGRMQLSLQGHYLKESDLGQIHGLVQDPNLQATTEQARIAEIGRKSFLGTLRRRVVLAAIAVSIVGYLAYKISPESEDEFRPLNYLGYEALALEEDPGRLDLPTTDIEDVRNYLDRYPGLSFVPRVLDDFDNSWAVDGATVIDYEVAKVGAVMYTNEDLGEKLIYFTYAGDLIDLPKSEPGELAGRGFIYQTYASDQLNIIAWQDNEGVMGLLVGRRSAPELAEIAVKGGSGSN